MAVVVRHCQGSERGNGSWLKEFTMKSKDVLVAVLRLLEAMARLATEVLE